MFKVGQKVWDIRYGWGVVEEVGEDNFPVLVDFGINKPIWYSIDGQYNGYENRSLFFEEIPIPESALVSKSWRANVAEKAYFVTATGHVDFFFDYVNLICNNLYETGNYFQTEEEAMESKFYKVFHEEEVNDSI